MARYFVTGATGFLGGELTKQLISRGHQAVALVRDPAKASLLRTLGVEIHQGDITDRESLRAPMAGVDGVFHCAAWYKVGADPARGRAHQRRRHAPRARDDARAGHSDAASTPAPSRCSRTRAARCPTSATATTVRTSVEYDRTKWRAHYEVALPMMARGPAAGHRACPASSTARATPAGCTPRSWTCCASGCRSRRGAPRSAGRTSKTPRAGTSWRWSAASSGETYIITGPRHTFEDAFDLVAQLAKVPRPLLHPGPRTDAGAWPP